MAKFHGRLCIAFSRLEGPEEEGWESPPQIVFDLDLNHFDTNNVESAFKSVKGLILPGEVVGIIAHAIRGIGELNWHGDTKGAQMRERKIVSEADAKAMEEAEKERQRVTFEAQKAEDKKRREEALAAEKEAVERREAELTGKAPAENPLPPELTKDVEGAKRGKGKSKGTA